MGHFYVCVFPIDSSVLRGLEGGFMFDITIQVGMSAAPAALGMFSVLSGKRQEVFHRTVSLTLLLPNLISLCMSFVIRSIDIQYLQKTPPIKDDIFIYLKLN